MGVKGLTRYERLIYDIVNSSSDHPTADRVLEKLRAMCPSVSRATVYNNLKKLCDSGLVRRVTLEGSPERYDRTERHDHLVCRGCGELSDIVLSDLTQSMRDQVGGDFLSYDLKVFYLCPTCKERRRDDLAVRSLGKESGQ